MTKEQEKWQKKIFLLSCYANVSEEDAEKFLRMYEAMEDIKRAGIEEFDV